MRWLDQIIDALYPRDPGEPDDASVWVKLFVLAMLVGLLALGIAANWHWRAGRQHYRQVNNRAMSVAVAGQCGAASRKAVQEHKPGQDCRAVASAPHFVARGRVSLRRAISLQSLQWNETTQWCNDAHAAALKQRVKGSRRADEPHFADIENSIQ
jgi:hypothetical protein